MLVGLKGSLEKVALPEEKFTPTQADWQNRPDPTFKYVTRQIADQLGIQAVETELPQTLRADLVLVVPEGLQLENTLFSFFRSINVIEFKSQNDHFDEREFIKNEVRTGLIYLQNPNTQISQILNLIVCSREPRHFFEYMREQGYNFQAEGTGDWLWHCRVGLQEVALVVCRNLPLEPKYFQWLAFAPADSQKWRNFVKIIARQGEWEIFNTLKTLRPKEVELMNRELIEILSHLSPKEQARVDRDWFDAIKLSLPRLAKTLPDEIGELLATIEPEKRLSGLTPEERLSGLNPEERLSGLTPEERQELLKKLLAEQTPKTE